ncbi:hypothetical protein CI102_453 [Trichoderma harzianum]|uniref:Uncharacterized protein n=1 Tax=Trichoderma harzianum CBS 226.95 TaxID=983964 RepID=A0A2T4AUI4_TRIHA|nr:hypothetical protein M431DRAFT_193978 [Trichoderma harzianum CBS 226.95]PKK54679.1 hypothetical protein CI102_453 [Trichoderma harzianum]PTB60699.1 hypothetical protein M431DRAFT_193978 [Trichoderma harzianum CBS 226.95]
MPCRVFAGGLHGTASIVSQPPTAIAWPRSLWPQWIEAIMHASTATGRQFVLCPNGDGTPVDQFCCQHSEECLLVS